MKKDTGIRKKLELFSIEHVLTISNAPLKVEYMYLISERENISKKELLFSVNVRTFNYRKRENKICKIN
jgi:hypothetical protein